MSCDVYTVNDFFIEQLPQVQAVHFWIACGEYRRMEITEEKYIDTVDRIMKSLDDIELNRLTQILINVYHLTRQTKVTRHFLMRLTTRFGGTNIRLIIYQITEAYNHCRAQHTKRAMNFDIIIISNPKKRILLTIYPKDVWNND